MLNSLFDYNECKNLILEGLLDSFRQCKNEIISFPRHPIGTTTIKGMSLDIFPWHNQIDVSFCSDDDIFEDSYIPNWKYNNFISSFQSGTEKHYSKSLELASGYISSFWDVSDEEEETDYYIDLRLKANVIFIAGAEAVLDKRISDCLLEFGIDSVRYSDDPIDTQNFFLVCDPDKTIEANYCDIIRASRASKLFFEELKEAKSFE